MNLSPESIKSILDIAVQLLVLVVPVAITWFIRTYVVPSVGGNRVAMITRLAGAAISYVENLDKRGDLALSPGARKGAEKLRLASEWLGAELKRAGVSVSPDDAQKWVSAEFQRQVGEVRPVAAIAALAAQAVQLVEGLEQHQLVAAPAGGDRAGYLTELAADWLVARLAGEEGASISRDEALTWVRAELVGRLQRRLGALSPDERLARLSEGARAFLAQLRAAGRLPDPAMATDIAAAWLLTESAREGLAVDGAQIVAAIERALRSDA